MRYEIVHTNPDVYRIAVPFSNFKLESTNCYVIHSEGAWLVVDTGAPSDAASSFLEAALDEIGVDLSRTAFFLTHLHLDHAGLVDRIVDPAAPLYLNERDYRYSETELACAYAAQLEALLAVEGFAAEAAGHAHAKRAFASFFSGDRTLNFVKEGDVIEVGALRFEVIETPGHTPGHLALWEPASRLLFSGDHVLFIISPNLGLFLPDGDGVQAYLDSLDKVAALAPAKLMHSHGPIRDDVSERVSWLHAHTLRRVERIRRAVEEAPGRTAADIITNMKWNVPHDRWEDIPGAQRLCVLENGLAALHHLVLDGVVARRTEGGLYRYEIAG